MLNHVFRFVLLIAVGIVPIYFMEIDNKLAIMVGWIIGVTLAYILGAFILRKQKKNRTNLKDQEDF